MTGFHQHPKSVYKQEEGPIQAPLNPKQAVPAAQTVPLDPLQNLTELLTAKPVRKEKTEALPQVHHREPAKEAAIAPQPTADKKEKAVDGATPTPNKRGQTIQNPTLSAQVLQKQKVRAQQILKAPELLIPIPKL